MRASAILLQFWHSMKALKAALLLGVCAVAVGAVRDVACGACVFKNVNGELVSLPCNRRTCNGTLDLSFMKINVISKWHSPFDDLLVTTILLNNNALMSLPMNVFYGARNLYNVNLDGNFLLCSPPLYGGTIPGRMSSCAEPVVSNAVNVAILLGVMVLVTAGCLTAFIQIAKLRSSARTTPVA